MIVYASRTGNVRYIVGKVTALDETVHVQDMNNIEEIEEPFLLITYSDAIGKAPARVLEFLQKHHTYCRGVIASGNRNFGYNFGAAADVIAQAYNIPALHKVDLRGTPSDHQLILDLYKERVCHVREHILET